MLAGSDRLPSCSNEVKAIVLEFMQYIVKPMVNSTLLDPRQGLQPETAKIIFESRLPAVSLRITSEVSSGT